MLRVAVLALGAILTIGAIAPHEAAAQLSGRSRSEGRIPTTRQPTTRSDGRILRDGNCYDQGRYDRRDDDERYESRGRGKGKDKADRRRGDDRYDDRYDDRNDSRYDNCDYGSRDRGKGPKFCRNGEGHPVYGMAWCRQKGWDNTYLRNVGWQDVILRRPRYGAQGTLGQSVLQDVLGRVVLGRFDQQRARLGVSQPLVGRWSDTSNGSLLNLFAGGLQIAQILDRNRDGQADVVLLNSGR